MNEARRTADFYLQLWDRGASMQRSLLREAEGQAGRRPAKARAQAAE